MWDSNTADDLADVKHFQVQIPSDSKKRGHIRCTDCPCMSLPASAEGFQRPGQGNPCCGIPGSVMVLHNLAIYEHCYEEPPRTDLPKLRDVRKNACAPTGPTWFPCGRRQQQDAQRQPVQLTLSDWAHHNHNHGLGMVLNLLQKLRTAQLTRAWRTSPA
jgi:hypothetical protein